MTFDGVVAADQNVNKVASGWHKASLLSLPSQGKQGNITVAAAVFNLITCVVGAASFGLPMQARKAGIVVPLFFLALSAVVSAETGRIWSECAQSWNAVKPVKEHITSLEAFGNAAFGRTGRLCISFLNICFYVGACGGYVILIGDTAYQALDMGWDKSNERYFRVLLGPICWVLCMFDDIKFLSNLAPLAVLAAFMGCFALIGNGFSDYGNFREWGEADAAVVYNTWPQEFQPTGSCISFMFIAYGIMGLVPTTANAMKEPAKLPLALIIMSVTVFLLYGFIIFACYGAYGNFITDKIINNMERYPASLAEAQGVLESPTDSSWQRWSVQSGMAWCWMARFSVLASVVLSYPFLMMTVFCSFQEFEYVKKMFPVGGRKNRLMRTALVLMTLLIAVAIEGFGTSFDLFASICLPFINVFVPLGCAWKIRQKLGSPSPGVLRYTMHVFFVIFALFALVFGTMDSIAQIRRQVSSDSSE